MVEMFKGVFFAVGTIIILALAIPFLPIDRINWGRLSVLPAATITVTGTAQGDVSNQVAQFSATVTVSDNDKQKATDAVNTKMTDLIKSVKDFGVQDADIKTQQVSVYQQPPVYPLGASTNGAGSGSAPSGTAQTLIYPVPPVRVGTGAWYASNTISITLRDVTKASGLSDILNNSGATNVYGPNFTTGVDNSVADADLLAKAVADAKSKAQTIAKAGGQTIGKMINVQEDGISNIYPMMMSAKGAGDTVSTPVQPGSTTLSKTVTVVFELK